MNNSSTQTSEQLLQIESFWNLINISDDAVQLGVYTLLSKKFSQKKTDESSPQISFRQMKGILEPIEDFENLRDEYINNKYGI